VDKYVKQITVHANSLFTREERHILNWRGLFDSLIMKVTQSVIKADPLMSNTRPVVIAGGCIRDIAMTNDWNYVKDIDICVLNTSYTNETKLVQEIGHNMCTQSSSKETALAIRYFYADHEGTRSNAIIFDGFFTGCDTRIQVMTSEAQSVADLFASFDMRACEFAYDGSHIYTSGIQDFEEGRITLNYKKTGAPTPLDTLRRGFLLSNKYFKTPHPLQFTRDDILTLANMELWR